MKEVNFIAILGLCLICSPQAFGQNSDYIGSRLVIECPKDSRISSDKIYKIYPSRKDLTVKSLSLIFQQPVSSDAYVGFYSTKPVNINVRKVIRPKIIEEDIA